MAKEKTTDGTGEKDPGPALPEESGTAAATAELPFSDMISRWLDDGDKLHETVHPAGEFSTEVAAHEGRFGAFVENARAQAHRHRRVLSGAAVLAVIVAVVAFRRANQSHPGTGEMVAVESTSAATASAAVTALATPPPSQPTAVAEAAPAATAAIPGAMGASDPSAPAAPAADPVAAAAPSPTAAAPAPAESPTPTTAAKPEAAPANLAAAAPAAPAPVAAGAPSGTGAVAPTGTPTAAVAVQETVVAATTPAHPEKTTPRDDPPASEVAAAEPQKAEKNPETRPEKAVSAVDSTAPALSTTPHKPRAPEASAGAAPLETCKTALIRQRSRDALAACSQVFGGDPRSADAMVLLARADLLAGRTSETLVLARRAVTANPRQADAYLLIGTIEQTTGQRREARIAYETYLQLSPYGAHASDVRAILRTL